MPAFEPFRGGAWAAPGGTCAPAAARASIPVFVVATIFGVIARLAQRSWVGYGEEPAGPCHVVGPGGIGEEAVVTDAMKSAGQDMDQEAADELVGVERHKLIASVGLGPVILPFEGHALAVEGDKPAIGNSSTVCVAGKVGVDGVGSAKRSLGIDDPFDLAQCGEEGLPAATNDRNHLTAVLQLSDPIIKPASR